MTLKAGLTAFALFGYSLSVSGFEIDGSKWPGGSADIYVSIEGISSSGVLWNTAFLSALEEWNTETDFSFNAIGTFRDPCAFDIVSGVAFTDDVCGSEYGENTLAVTLRRFREEILGPPKIFESDIVFNNDVDYDVFNGSLIAFGRPRGTIDFRRVALHELGHALGLEHEESNSAIMAPNISNLDSLQQDDIDGVNALYGGLSNCAISDLQFGLINNALESGDCRVSELTVGGTDTSFIDLYRFSVDQSTRVEFEMDSNSLDTVLVLATAGLEFLDVSNIDVGICESSLSATLEPGNYLILGNTFVNPVRPECGNTGPYSLQAAFFTENLVNLGATLSLQGESSESTFKGGITRNSGTEFSNLFKPTDSLNIEAEISVQPSHAGQFGFIVIVASVDGELLFRNAAGDYQSSPNNQIIRASTKILTSTESVSVLSDLVPNDLGIQNINVDFIVGYGLNSDPSEVFYHAEPISLTVAP